MALGGKRPGAGRPKAPHTKAAEAFRAYLIAETMKEKEPIVKALIRAAKNGEVKALAELLDRVLGRPVTPIAGADEDGNVLPFQIVIKRRPDESGD